MTTRRVILLASVVVASVSCGGATGTGIASPPALPPGFFTMDQTTPPSTARTLERAPISDPIRPPESYWDRYQLACTHARATCGGWDGFSCDPTGAAPPDKEHAARSEFARIDAEARAVCPEDDEAKQVYSGNAKEVIGAVDAALRGTEKLSKRLADLREVHQTAAWEVATFAREGSLYDCIWNSLKAAPPPPPPLISSQQQALLNRLTTIAGQLNGGGQQLVQAQVNATRQQIMAKWQEAKDKYLDVLETKMVRQYVTAAFLARRYALDGFSFTRAHARLPVVASILGDEKMARLLADVIDPTDPEPDPTKRRRVAYRPGVFGVAP